MHNFGKILPEKMSIKVTHYAYLWAPRNNQISQISKIWPYFYSNLFQSEFADTSLKSIR